MFMRSDLVGYTCVGCAWQFIPAKLFIIICIGVLGVLLKLGDTIQPTHSLDHLSGFGFQY